MPDCGAPSPSSIECRQIADLLGDYLDGSLPNSTRPGRVLVWIEQDPRSDRPAVGEVGHPCPRLPVVHEQDGEGPAGQTLLELLNRRHLGPARLAPRRPEVHEDDAVPIVGERM